MIFMNTLQKMLKQGLILRIKNTIRAGKDIIGSVQDFQVPPHPLTNFEKQKYYQNELKLNGAYSKNNLPKLKDRAYVISLAEFKSIGNHSIALYVNVSNMIYLDSFGVVEHIQNKKFKKFKNIYIYHNKYL